MAMEKTYFEKTLKEHILSSPDNFVKKEEALKSALEAFDEARKYYHVTTDLSKIPDVDKLSDKELPGLFNQNDSRQLIHITYGLILTKKNPDGSFTFRDRLYKFWKDHEEDYALALEKHIGKHLTELGVRKS